MLNGHKTRFLDCKNIFNTLEYISIIVEKISLEIYWKEGLKIIIFATLHISEKGVPVNLVVWQERQTERRM